MIKFKKKLIALVSIFALMAPAMPAWAEESTGDAVEAEEETKDPYDGLEPDSIVLTVGEDKVPLKKAYFLMKFQQSIVQDMQKSVYGSLWYSLPVYEGDRSFQDNMKESIMNLLVRMSLARQHQEEYGVTISKSEKKKIEETVDTFFASNSDKALEAMMADRETVTEILTDYTILSKVIASVTKDTKVEYGKARTYSYVYGSFGDDAGSALEDVSESTESLLEDFNNIRSKAVSSGNFDSAAAESGYPTAIHTYFIEDDSDKLAEFNQAMEGLKEGEVSKVTYIGNNKGVFIGCLQELDEDSLEDAKKSLLQNEQLKVLKKTTGQWIDKAEPVMDEDIWNQVTMKKPLAAYRSLSEE